MQEIIKELCVGSIDDVISLTNQQLSNFSRFETCSSLEFGGYTPNIELYKFIKNNFKKHSQVIMIRNSESFLLEDEAKIVSLEKDIETFLNLDANEFIFGYLTKENEIDVALLERLIKKVKLKNNTSYCFHMAIDEVNDYEKAIETLIGLKFKRILLKGGKQPAIFNTKRLQELAHKYSHKIEFIVGGKVDANNYLQIVKETKINQVHGRKIV